MKNRVGRLLSIALGVAATALAPGCGLLPTKYELEVESAENVAAQLQSLYVILAPSSEVQEPLASPAQYAKLLDETRINKYLTFVQYEPVENGTWRVVNEGRVNEFVTLEIDEKTIEIEIDLELTEKSSRDYSLVVLGFFGSGGFEQVTVEHAVIDGEGRQVVEVGAGSLLLRNQ
jgi:hypothetical protein